MSLKPGMDAPFKTLNSPSTSPSTFSSIYLMLPLHNTRDEESKSLGRRWLGRPLARWAALGVCLVLGFWFLTPLVFEWHDDIRFTPRFTLLPLQDVFGVKAQPGLVMGTMPPKLDDSRLWNQRAAKVRDAYKHGYNHYLKYAAGHDELLPLSNGWQDNFNGWGVSMIDSMDTMWIMGLRAEFDDAVRVVAQQNFTQITGFYAPFFETVIRYLGGLLSAYALSGETILLARADDLGARLLPAFNSPSGLPRFGVNPATGDTSLGWTGGPVLFAEAASCQVEYKYLAHLTGRAEYFERVENVMDKIYAANVTDGLFATQWDPADAMPLDTHFSVGASVDSGYEYLLKQYLLSSKSETRAKSQYLASMDGIINHLLYLSPTRKLLYVTDTSYGTPTHNLEHLACFLPGLLALGAHTLPAADLSPHDRERHMWAARGLAYTCYVTYADQRTGLGPDGVQFDEGGTRWVEALGEWEAEGRAGGVPPGVNEVLPEQDKEKRDYQDSSSVYILRPETVESFFVLWKTTGDVKWRERGWAVFQALEKHARVQNGYASVHDVDEVPAVPNDDMPSYFLAETLKYLYLLFAEADIVPLDKWVFNTEAHPLPVFTWSQWERKAYNIRT
ncbi:hypothetical protein PTI98_012347 [Pleurotus ostreatus]|nr:hypothetical protein PTI98_012347 [Pleurotus ostreatus]